MAHFSSIQRGKIRGQILLAGTLWLIVGVILSLRALGWLYIHQYGVKIFCLCILGGAVIGLLKGNMVLDKTARKAISRIHERGDGASIFGFFSMKNWLLIALMIVLGRLLRTSPAPIPLVSTVYIAIGTALSYSSRQFFTAL